MKKLLLALGLWATFVSSAIAQNPTCPTRPAGDSTNACASTAFVQTAINTSSFGGAIKAPVRAATTANITLSGAQTIDGVSIIAGDRVLVNNQSTGSQNGIYVAAAGAWSRAVDANETGELVTGTLTYVTSGTINGGALYVITTTGTITIDTTSIAWVTSAPTTFTSTTTFKNAITAIDLNSASPSIKWTEGATSFNIVLDGDVFGIRNAGAFPGILQIDAVNQNRVTIQRTATIANEVAAFVVSKTESIAGGTPGFISATQQITHTIAAGVTNYASGLVVTTTNAATSVDNSENNAAYFRTVKNGTGKSWATTHELDDSTGANPIAASQTVELDHWAGGGDSNSKRGILDLIAGNPRAVAGGAPTIARALRIAAYNAVNANASFSYGMTFAGATFGTLIGFEGTPAVTNGIDFTGVTFSGSPFQSIGFSVGSSGAVNGTDFRADAAGSHYWNGRSRIRSGADGNISLLNASENSFGLLQLGGTTSSFPAIKRNAAGIDFRLADDSAAAAVTALSFNGLVIPATTGSISIANGKTVTFSNTLTFTGTDSSSVAFGAGGTVVYTTVTALSSLATVGTITSGVWNAGAVTSSGEIATASNFKASDSGAFYWPSRTQIWSDADGNIRVNQNSGSGFGRLQFGGTSSSFPSWKRSSAVLIARLADDSADTSIQASTIVLSAVANATTTSALCYNTGTGAVTYNSTVGTCTVSDATLKNVEGPIVSALDKLLMIHGVYFNWKDPSQYGSGRQIGVLAQEVERAFPELVSTDSTGRKSADYQRIVAPIIEALRELKADNDNLRLRLRHLEAR